MIRVKDESDFSNWFKKNYKKLGFSKIIEANTKKCPDFIMLENGKRKGVELEVKSSNFLLHRHDLKKVDEVICIIKDKKLSIPIRVVKNIRIAKWKEKDSPYYFKSQVFSLFKKIKIRTTSEIAKLLGVNWNTAEKYLLELVIEGKIEKIKKMGVNLWIIKK